MTDIAWPKLIGRDQPRMPPPPSPAGQFTRCSICGGWGVIALVLLDDRPTPVWVHDRISRLGPFRYARRRVCRIQKTLA